jgi:hypothetical protein
MKFQVPVSGFQSQMERPSLGLKTEDYFLRRSAWRFVF